MGQFLRTLLAGAAAVLSPRSRTHSNRPDFSKVEIKTTQIADNFYTLEAWAAPSAC
jgi:hypothetical protein